MDTFYFQMALTAAVLYALSVGMLARAVSRRAAARAAVCRVRRAKESEAREVSLRAMRGKLAALGLALSRRLFVASFAGAALWSLIALLVLDSAPWKLLAAVSLVSVLEFCLSARAAWVELGEGECSCGAAPPCRRRSCVSPEDCGGCE